MSAIAWYAGQEKWTDDAECVDPAIRQLCIAVNDRLPTDAERERVIAPHLMTPMGTRTADPVIRRRRMERIVGFAMEQARDALTDAGRKDLAEPMMRFCGTCPEEGWGEARAAAYAAYAAYAAAAAAAARAAAAAAYAYAAAAAASDAAYAVAYAAASERAEFAETRLLPLILELCAIGERVEVPQVRRLEELPR